MIIGRMPERGRLAALARGACATLAVLALVTQGPFPLGGPSQTAQALTNAGTVRVNAAGYGAERDVQFTYDPKELALKEAQFTTSKGDDGNPQFLFSKKATRIAYSHDGGTSQVRDGAVVLGGKAKTTKDRYVAQSVDGSFSLKWKGAVVDAFGKRYDLTMTVSDVSYCNPTGLVFENGIAIMQGALVEQATIKSSKVLSEATKVSDRVRTRARTCTVDAGEHWTAGSKASEEYASGSQGKTSACAWVCDYTDADGKSYDNIETLHEKYYTGTRTATWDGLTWDLKDASEGQKKSVSSAKSPGDDYEKHWVRSWKSDECSSLENLEVGVSMDVTVSVTDTATGRPVSGGTLGMGFRDLDQPDIGASTYSGAGRFCEGIRIGEGFLDAEGGQENPVVFVNPTTCLKSDRSGGSTVSNGQEASFLYGSRGTDGKEAEDSGFTVKANAAGFSYGWEGAKCGTQLFTPTELSPAGVDIAVQGVKTVDGHAPESGLAGRFSFGLYRDTGSTAGDDTTVRAYGEKNEPLDENGAEIGEDASGQVGEAAPIHAENDEDGSFALHLGYWTLMRALGYEDTSAILGIADQDGLYGKWCRFTMTERDDSLALVDGSHVVDRRSETVWVKLESDGKGGLDFDAQRDLRYGPDKDQDPTPINNLEVCEAQIAVKKTLANESPLPSPDITGLYTFTLSAQDGAPMPSEGDATAANPSPEGGVATFAPIAFAKVGDYSYRVTEACGSEAPAFVADDEKAASGKLVTVHVYEGEDGHKHADVGAADPASAYPGADADGASGPAGVEFVNRYEPPSVEIPVEKTLETGGSSAPPDIRGRFSFRLTALDGAPMPTDGGDSAVNPDSDGGTASFGRIFFSQPGTYHYRVAETGEVTGVRNDAEAVKDAEVVVSDNGEVSVNGGAGVKFANVYVPEVAMPLAGGRLMWAALAAAGAVAALCGAAAWSRRRRRA